MPGWTVTIWDENDPAWTPLDWASADFLNEYVDAVNERLLAIRLGGQCLDAVQPGDDVQLTATYPNYPEWPQDESGIIWELQRAVIAHWVEDQDISLLKFFARSHEADTSKRSLAFWHTSAEAYIPDYYPTDDAARIAAGLPSPLFRRYRDKPPSEGGTLEAPGLIQPGDIIGPWIFEDLQKILNVLIWTSECDYRPFIEGAGERWYGWQGSANQSYETWVEAKSVASGDFKYIAWASTIYAYTRGYQPTNWYQAEMARGERKMWAIHSPTSMAREVAWYNHASAYGDFNNNGDPVLDGLWSRWLTEQYAVTVPAITSVFLGQASSPPVWCEKPPAQYVTTMRGYGVTDISNVISWDVAGGFTYR